MGESGSQALRALLNRTQCKEQPLECLGSTSNQPPIAIRWQRTLASLDCTARGCIHEKCDGEYVSRLDRLIERVSALEEEVALLKNDRESVFNMLEHRFLGREDKYLAGV